MLILSTDDSPFILLFEGGKSMTARGQSKKYLTLKSQEAGICSRVRPPAMMGLASALGALSRLHLSRCAVLLDVAKLPT